MSSRNLEVDPEYSIYKATINVKRKSRLEKLLEQDEQRRCNDTKKDCELEGTYEIQRRKSAELSKFLESSKNNPIGCFIISKTVIRQNIPESVALLSSLKMGIVTIGLVKRILDGYKDVSYGHIGNIFAKMQKSGIFFEVDGTEYYKEQIKSFDKAFKKYSNCHNKNTVLHKYYGLTEEGRGLVSFFEMQLTEILRVPVRRIIMDRSYKMLFTQNRK